MMVDQTLGHYSKNDQAKQQPTPPEGSADERNGGKQYPAVSDLRT